MYTSSTPSKKRTPNYLGKSWNCIIKTKIKIISENSNSKFNLAKKFYNMYIAIFIKKIPREKKYMILFVCVLGFS